MVGTPSPREADNLEIPEFASWQSHLRGFELTVRQAWFLSSPAVWPKGGCGAIGVSEGY